MLQEPAGPITQLLHSVADGDVQATGQLWSLVYTEMRRMAGRQMVPERAGHAMQPTALVHEAYLRLFGNQNVDWANSHEFFGAAARVMRQIRIDDARRRKRLKRGGGQPAVRVTEALSIFDQDIDEVLGVHEALDRLEREEPRKAEIVMLRYFSGLTEEETAAAMKLSRRTVQLEWQIARAWLHRELSKGDTKFAPELR